MGLEQPQEKSLKSGAEEILKEPEAALAAAKQAVPPEASVGGGSSGGAAPAQKQEGKGTGKGKEKVVPITDINELVKTMAKIVLKNSQEIRALSTSQIATIAPPDQPPADRQAEREHGQVLECSLSNDDTRAATARAGPAGLALHEYHYQLGGGGWQAEQAAAEHIDSPGGSCGGCYPHLGGRSDREGQGAVGTLVGMHTQACGLFFDGLCGAGAQAL